MRRPVIGVTACRRVCDGVFYYQTRSRYLDVLVSLGAIPVVISAMGRSADLLELAEDLDGILLTGSESNIAAGRYSAGQSSANRVEDPYRDETILPVLPHLVRSGLPVLGICRGMQEMNVAFGGSLYQSLHLVRGMLDHRENLSLPRDDQYLPAHEVDLTPGGRLAGIYGVHSLYVNSLHQQGIERLGSTLVAEGRSKDGLIEAISVANAPSFALGVQWHPEWRDDDLTAPPLFTEFIMAARAHVQGGVCASHSQEKKNVAIIGYS